MKKVIANFKVNKVIMVLIIALCFLVFSGLAIAEGFEEDVQFKIQSEALNMQALGKEGMVVVNWTLYGFEGPVGYNIYRSEKMEGTYTKLTSSPISAEERFYEDSHVLPGQTYYYKLTVVKSDLTESGYSNIAAAASLDTVSPVIIHNPVRAGIADMPIEVIADISDNMNVAEAYLYFRPIGAVDYTQLEMQHNMNNYYVTIEGEQVQAPGLEYYIEASDGITTVRNGQSDNPIQIEVSFAPDIVSIDPEEGSSLGGTEVTITGSNFKEGAIVTFGEAIASNVVVESTGIIRAVAPSHIPGVADVKVTNSDGYSDTLFHAFTYKSEGVEVRLPNVQGTRGKTVEIPLTISNITGLRSADIKMSFDPEVLSVKAVRLGSISEGFSLAVNKNISGEVQFSMASATGVSGTGVLAYLDFEAMDSEKLSSDLTMEAVNLNSGNISAMITNGGFTFASLYSISGEITYFKNAKIVENVELMLDGIKDYSGASDDNGNYMINGIESGDYVLTPHKNDAISDITSYDASLILRYAVGLIELSDQEKCAADVDRNDIIDGMDAAYVLEKAVGLTQSPFPGSGGAWDFIPGEQSLSLNQDQADVNFTAVLIGDVSGNWGESGEAGESGNAGILSIMSTDGPEYSIGTARVQPGGTITLPLIADLKDAKLYGTDLVISYNSNLASALLVEKGTLAGDASLVYNLETPGVIRIALAGSEAIEGKGQLLKLTFQVINDAGLNLPLFIDQGLMNEDRVSSIINGKLLITIIGDTNLDKKVDLLDLTLTAQGYGTRDIDIDSNGDGIIDLYDLVVVGRKMGSKFIEQ